MRRVKNSSKKKRPPTTTTTTVMAEIRQSMTPLVVICHSNDSLNNNHNKKNSRQFSLSDLCSKTGKWSVIVHHPDTNKWWDCLSSSIRARHGPPANETLCHVIVVYRRSLQDDNVNNVHMNQPINNDDDDDDDHSNNNVMIHNAVKLLGESIEIATVLLLNEPATLSHGKEDLESAVTNNQVIISNLNPFSSYTDLRQLWAIQDAHNQPQPPLEPWHVEQVCHYWSPLRWRWNKHRLVQLYQCLCHGYMEQDKNASPLPGLESDHWNAARRALETKAAMLWQDKGNDTRRVVDYILTRGATHDEHLFGRMHAWALSRLPWHPREDTPYLIVTPSSSSSKKTTYLSAPDFATGNHCTQVLEQVKIVTQAELTSDHLQQYQQRQRQFSIPVGNPMVTVSLIPALFPTGVEYNGSCNPYQFDAVLGSQRIWEEHMTLKVSILYLFQGQPGRLWDLCHQVVQNALPRTWRVLFQSEAAPEQDFLRALWHPQVIQAGRLLRCESDGKPSLLPAYFSVLSRMYALGRFVQTLDNLQSLLNNVATRYKLASTMKLQVNHVNAIIQRACQETTSLTFDWCANNCLGLLEESAKNHETCCVDSSMEMTQDSREILGMLAVFLNHDRKSAKDASRFDLDSFNNDGHGDAARTSMALTDCAMYCGKLRWLSQDEQDEEGIWTCASCLHRWQQRGHVREAYQTRKMMHPMTLTPFTREEYYDPVEYDAIMEATFGDISQLGKDFYWGRCDNKGCGKICRAVARSGACAETDGVPLYDFPEIVILNDGSGDKLQLRNVLQAMGPLRFNNIVTSDNLEKYFDSEEKLMCLAGPTRRRVRNCIDKSKYILPVGFLCDTCGAVPDDAIDEYCPYCGTGFEPVFACVHYSCPQCGKHFCKACLGIEGIHFTNVYSSQDHACWRILGNRYSYHNKGYCAKCHLERPWPKSHALVSAGPEIRKRALALKNGDGMPLAKAVEMQTANLTAFTERYEEGVEIFEKCLHTVGLGDEYCHCGTGVIADNFADYD